MDWDTYRTEKEETVILYICRMESYWKECPERN